MRRVGLFAVVVTLAALAATSSRSASRIASPRVNCRASVLTFLFWPQGHPAIPSIGFPSFPIPHLEVYRTDPTFPSGNQVAFAGLTSDQSRAGGGFGSSCGSVAVKAFKPMPAPRTTSDTTQLVCVFPKTAQLDYVTTDTPVGVTMRGFVQIKQKKRRKAALTLVVSAQLRSSGSTIKYDAKLCRAHAAPS